MDDGPRRPLPPAEYHERNRAHPGPFSTCAKCWRARRVCRSKIRFNRYEAADIAVDNLNQSRNYVRPVTRYRCRWCMAWHMTTAKGRIQLKRAERQRRKWLRRITGAT